MRSLLLFWKYLQELPLLYRWLFIAEIVVLNLILIGYIVILLA